MQFPVTISSACLDLPNIIIIHRLTWGTCVPGARVHASEAGGRSSFPTLGGGAGLGAPSGSWGPSPYRTRASLRAPFFFFFPGGQLKFYG